MKKIIYYMKFKSFIISFRFQYTDSIIFSSAPIRNRMDSQI